MEVHKKMDRTSAPFAEPVIAPSAEPFSGCSRSPMKTNQLGVNRGCDTKRSTSMTLSTKMKVKNKI